MLRQTLPSGFDVGVVDLGDALDLGRLVLVVGADAEGELEAAVAEEPRHRPDAGGEAAGGRREDQPGG